MLDLLKQAQEMIEISTFRCSLDIPFYEQSDISGDLEQQCDTLYVFLLSLSRKTSLNFLELRIMLGKEYDTTAQILGDIFDQISRFKRSTKELVRMTSEFRELTSKTDEHLIRKYKNSPSTSLSRKSQELQGHINMMCIWDTKLEHSIVAYCEKIALLYQIALKNAAPIVYDSLKTNSLKTFSTKNEYSNTMEEFNSNINSGIRRSRSLAASPIPGKRLSLDFAFPEDVDPLIVLWLRKYSFTKYIPLFKSKKIIFNQFANLTDIDFAELGVVSGEDCMSMGMLLSNRSSKDSKILIKEAVFKKKGNVRRNWKKRVFKLVSTYELLYCSTKDIRAKPIGSIDLIEVMEVRRIPPSIVEEKHHHCLELITKDRSWILSATEYIVYHWDQILCEIIKFISINEITRPLRDKYP